MIRTDIKTALVFGVVITIGLGVLGVVFSTLDAANLTTESALTEEGGIIDIDKSGFKMAPDIEGIAHYLNTADQNELEEMMEDKVVLYDIWTYSCINCLRTLPYIVAWDEKYSDQGLLIIGVHSPEFEFEKNLDNVEMAVNKYGIEYPVVMDNDWEVWKAFENRYWPRKYVADHEGYIRYDRIGEGGYADTEKVIQGLLAERSAALGMQTSVSSASLVDIAEFEHSVMRTPELYFGYYFAQGRDGLGSKEGFNPEGVITYSDPFVVELHKFYPVGTWENGRDGMKLVSTEGTIKLHYTAKEVNIVASSALAAAADYRVHLEIMVDGLPVSSELSGDDVDEVGIVDIVDPGLYNIIRAENGQSSEHLLEIMVDGKGFEIFTFTFG